MNLTKKTILALGLVVAGASFAQTAQTASTSAAPVGLLGQEYSEAHLTVSDIKHFAKDQTVLGVAANVPVSPYLDLGAGYDYGWIHGLGHFNTVNTSATAYTTFQGVKPFVSGDLGYQWSNYTGGHDDLALWGVAAGVQIPVSVITVTPRIVYSDDFHGKSRSQQATSYEVEGNYWVTRTAAVYASVGYSDIRHSSNDSWDYTVGARFKF